MLLALRSLLESAAQTADVSWLEIRHDPIASASVVESGDTLAAAATVALVASSSVTEGGDTLSALAGTGLFASADITEGGDSLASSANAAAGVTGIVSWLEIAPPSGATASITESADTLVATATVPALATARVSWLELAPYVAPTTDGQVAGSWSPALHTRWLMLTDGPVSTGGATVSVPIGAARRAGIATAVRTSAASPQRSPVINRGNRRAT